MNERIQILCAADAAYGPWAGVMLSAVLAQDHGAPVDIHLFSDKIRKSDLARMAKMAAARGAGFKTYEVEALLRAETKGLHISMTISRTAYARLFLDRLVDQSVDRLIYLDCDILCLGSLMPVWRFDLQGEAIGAVGDIGQAAPAALRATNRRLGLPEDQPYYNSGVMLIDVAKWRAADVGGRALEFARAMGNRLGWWDQDAINGVMGPRIRPMPKQWNFQAGRAARPQGDEVLVHFIGTVKPWDLDHGGTFSREYRRALAASPWRFTLRLPNAVRRLRYSYRKRIAKLRALWARAKKG